MISITPDEIKAWAQMVYQACGIVLDGSKGYLLEGRLANLLKETNSTSFSELLYKVRSDPTKVLSRKVVDAMTTNETSFFSRFFAIRPFAAQTAARTHRPPQQSSETGRTYSHTNLERGLLDRPGSLQHRHCSARIARHVKQLSAADSGHRHF